MILEKKSYFIAKFPAFYNVTIFNFQNVTP